MVLFTIYFSDFKNGFILLHGIQDIDVEIVIK